MATDRNAEARQRALRESEEWVRGKIWALEDAAARTLLEIYRAAFGELSQRLISIWLQYGFKETWSINDANYRERTEALLYQIQAEIDRLAERSAEVVLTAGERAYQGSFYGRAWVLDTGARGGINIPTLLPTDAIRAALLAPYRGSTFLDRFADAKSEFERLIRRSIIDSQIRGESISQAVKRLQAALGVVSREEKRALFARIEMIARTEILRASNLGALAIYEANEDILQGWEWLATNDERTCPICGALDGKVFKFGGIQSPPPAHPRCRCSELPVLIDSKLSERIAGKRQTYPEWAAAQGINRSNDGGVLQFRSAPPPKSNSDAAKVAAKSY